MNSVVFDPFSPDFIADPYPFLHRIRLEDPVHRSPMGFWLITRYDDVAFVLNNSHLFGVGNMREHLKLRLGDGAAYAYVSRRMNLLDPPDHTLLRALVTRAFTARRVAEMRVHVETLAANLLDAVGKNRMEVIADLAHPLPSLVICEMLGIPEADRTQLSDWTSDIQLILGTVTTPEWLAIGEKAAADFLEYARSLVKERRKKLGDDLLSALIVAEENGGRLTEDALLATVIILFAAGHSTTRDLVANGLIAILRHPGQWQRLMADSSLLPAAIEECLRYDSPVAIFPRTALTDTTIHGTKITAGELVWVSISAANRDPARFTDPDRFDIDRPDNEHLSFGRGIHYCLGAGLARTQADIIFTMLLRRYPNLALAEQRIDWRPTLFRGPAALHVTF